MKKIAFILFISVLCSNIYAENKSIDSILKELDHVLLNKEIYSQEKEQRISETMKMLELPNINLRQLYDINNRLYNEYKVFIPDSAVVYTKKNVQIAEELKDSVWIYESKLNLSLLYSVAGMYIDAVEILQSILPRELSEEWLVRKYYEAYKQLFYYYSPESKYSQKYALYRDSLLASIPNGSNDYKIVYSEKLLDAGQPAEARDLLMQMFNESEEHAHWNAVLAYAIGETYRVEKNYEMQKKYYAISAVSDVRSAIKENASLRALSKAFYETNDIENAYKYIQYSLEDAIFSNSHLRTVEVSQIFPIIEKAYLHKTQKQNRTLIITLICIAVLTLFLIAAVAYVYVQMNRLKKIRRSLYHANKDLNGLNDNLHSINVEMVEKNKELSESNLLKEEYIARYMDQCSAYLDKLENYRRSLNKIAATGKVEELYKTLKSKQFMEDELKEFYANFDNSFLQLFPNFVDDFNALLLEDEKIYPKQKELLNTELRIFALIRLGITDSTKIAQFLRYPVNTIYNYRTKVRNKAAGVRDEFEKNVIKIGILNAE